MGASLADAIESETSKLKIIQKAELDQRQHYNAEQLQVLKRTLVKE